MKINQNLLILFAIAGMVPPLIFRLINWHNGEGLSDWPSFVGGIGISVLTTVTISIGVVQVLLWLRERHPWRQGIVKRVFLEISLTTLTACVLIILLSLLSHAISPKEDLEAAIFNNLIVALLMNFVLVAVTEGIFFFRQWKEAAVEAERYKREHILAQFESLKNQVNPHFLFNSLNTLSSLIDEDKEMSKAFLDDLSTVYRYVLQHKEEEVVLLKTELTFFRAYTQLLKKRHGDRVSFHFNIATEELSNGIPPMALQLLGENAVKHNIASRKKPLKIEIYTTDGYLVVRNNLQKKREVKSTGVGLKNIQNTYQYLSDKNVEIKESETLFEVRLPILLIAENPKR